MGLTSHLLQRLLKLPPPLTRSLVVERDLAVPAHDGVTLLADRWAPREHSGPLPTVLMRSPYGRRGAVASLLGRAYAERGFQVVTASVRGTFGSGGGEFLAMRNDREDGEATLDWLTKQPWFDGSIVLAGPSYLGYTQWAVATGAPAQVKAMIPQVTSARLALAFLRPGRIELETLLTWSTATATQERPFALVRALLGLGRRRTRAAMDHLPLAEADQVAIGRQWPFYQECLHHDNEDPYWRQWDHSSEVGSVTVPTSMIAGWYDIFLIDQLRDYAAMVAAGRQPRLTIGPWVHSAPEGIAVGVREAMDWAGALCREEAVPDRKPISLFVMGTGQWREFDSWPPAGYSPQRWNLLPGNGLGLDAAPAGPPSAYRYDPANPTPSVGGPKLERADCGRVDNKRLESRSDVLVFSSPPLAQDVEVIGEVGAEVWLSSSRANTDLFVRVCDVDERGRSFNVCDELVGVEVDGVTKVAVALSPTAHCFRRGHRIRVVIASAAFPRYARNLGGGEPVYSATVMHVADQAVFHDPEHPSAVLLPVRS